MIAYLVCLQVVGQNHLKDHLLSGDNSRRFFTCLFSNWEMPPSLSTPAGIRSLVLDCLNDIQPGGLPSGIEGGHLGDTQGNDDTDH